MNKFNIGDKVRYGPKDDTFTVDELFITESGRLIVIEKPFPCISVRHNADSLELVERATEEKPMNNKTKAYLKAKELTEGNNAIIEILLREDGYLVRGGLADVNGDYTLARHVIAYGTHNLLEAAVFQVFQAVRTSDLFKYVECE